MNALGSITYADVPGFPAGSVVSTIAVTLIGTANTTPIVQDLAPGTASVEFANIAADTYAFTVAGQDASGNVFGTAVTGTFTITAPATVTLSLPVTVTFTQS